MKYVIALIQAILTTTIVLGIAILIPLHKKTPAKLPFIVRLHDKKTGRFFCSGSVISDKYILTAGHCVLISMPIIDMKMLNLEEIEIRAEDGSATGVTVMAYRAQLQSDLAILTGDLHIFEKAKVITQPAEVIKAYERNNLKACGYPYGGALFCNLIHFRHIRVFAMSAEGYLYPGMSGGPVIDQSTGAIVGVNSAIDGEYLVEVPTTELYSMFDLDAKQ